VKVFGNMPLGALAHPPGERPGTPLREHVHHQRTPPPAHAAPIPDPHERLSGQWMQEHCGRR
jgi:hypothetical protein